MRKVYAILMASCSFSTCTAQTIDTITVTARGRTEALIAVPDSISVFSRADIERRKLSSIEDIISATPGVFIVHDQDPGTNTITVRGVATNINQEASVGFVVDGLALPDSELFTLRPFDLQHVEVLKGPQGALFGRSASGGVVAYETVKPSNHFGGFAQAGYANGNTKTLDAAVDVPLSSHLSTRLSGSLMSTDGLIYNSYLKRTVDDYVSRNIRSTTRLLVSDAITLDVRLSLADEAGGSTWISSENATGLTGGRLAGDILKNPQGDFLGRGDRRYYGEAATVAVALPNGDSLKFITGYDHYHKNFSEEFDFRNGPVSSQGVDYPQGVQPIQQPVALVSETAELRYTSSSAKPLRWIVGSFVQTTKKQVINDYHGFGDPNPHVINNHSFELGLFMAANYDINQQFELSAALRYDLDSKRRERTTPKLGTIDGLQNKDFASWQPKLSLSWHPHRTFNAYVTASVGFKPGGFNPMRNPAFDPPFAPTFQSESTRALEAGLKWQSSSGGLRTTLAGFITDYRHYQNTEFFSDDTVFSVPKVNVHGLEASTHLGLPAGFAIDASASWTSARIGTYQAPSPLDGSILIDYKNNRLAHAPEYSADLTLLWQHQIGAFTLDWRLDYNRLGRVYYEIDNILYSPPRGTLDGRLALTLGKITTEVWAKNISNMRYATSGFGQRQSPFLLDLKPGGPFDSFSINKGRTFGASVKVVF